MKPCFDFMKRFGSNQNPKKLSWYSHFGVSLVKKQVLQKPNEAFEIKSIFV
jgi:hypothetical protein